MEIRRIAVVFGRHVNTVRIFGQTNTRATYAKQLSQKQTDLLWPITREAPIAGAAERVMAVVVPYAWRGRLP